VTIVGLQRALCSVLIPRWQRERPWLVTLAKVATISAEFPATEFDALSERLVRQLGRPKRADTSFRDGDIELDQVFDCAAATIASVELLHRIRLRTVGQSAPAIWNAVLAVRPAPEHSRSRSPARNNCTRTCRTTPQNWGCPFKS